MSDRVELTDARCGYTVTDIDGNEEPCDLPATGHRWYQDVGEHEDLLDVACDHHRNEGGRLISSLRAELASANARCAELEGEVGEWKSEADDQREAFVWANSACQEQATQKWAALAERDALQATLDRVTAVLDEWKLCLRDPKRRTGWSGGAVLADLRAALTPEGSE